MKETSSVCVPVSRVAYRHATQLAKRDNIPLRMVINSAIALLHELDASGVVQLQYTKGGGVDVRLAPRAMRNVADGLQWELEQQASNDMMN